MYFRYDFLWVVYIDVVESSGKDKKFFYYFKFCKVDRFDLKGLGVN